MELNNIAVTYCSNYNGCYLYGTINGEQVDLEDVPEFADKAARCVSNIIDQAVEECSEDGNFYGDIDELAKFSTATVKRIFGETVTVTFEEDNISS